MSLHRLPLILLVVLALGCDDDTQPAPAAQDATMSTADGASPDGATPPRPDGTPPTDDDAAPLPAMDERGG